MYLRLPQGHSLRDLPPNLGIYKNQKPTHDENFCLERMLLHKTSGNINISFTTAKRKLMAFT
jgi:hypothetical protein